jgi:hypothetical protein
MERGFVARPYALLEFGWRIPAKSMRQRQCGKQDFPLDN